MSSSDERRAHPRHACDMAVTIISDELAWIGTILDFSKGGIFVSSTLQPTVGSVLQFRFQHPTDGSQVQIDGEVRHVVKETEAAGERTGFGVFFAHLLSSTSPVE